jgi:hypothetical protein
MITNVLGEPISSTYSQIENYEVLIGWIRRRKSNNEVIKNKKLLKFLNIKIRKILN